MKRRSVMVALLACGMLVRAEATDQNKPSAPAQPTSKPAVHANTADGAHGGPFLGSGLTDEQKKDAADFLSEHTPNRYQAYEQLMTTGQHPNIQRAIVRGYLELHMIETQDRELYKMKLQELEIEDKIFGIVSDARQKDPDLNRKQLHEKLHDQLRPLTTQLLEKRKEESQRRLDRMRLAVQNEEKRLEDLQTADADPAVVDKYSDGEIESGDRMLGMLAGAPYRFGNHVAPPVPAPATESIDADKVH